MKQTNIIEVHYLKKYLIHENKQEHLMGCTNHDKIEEQEVNLFPFARSRTITEEINLL